MRPELFTISLPDWNWLPVHELPVRGYGAMLALGFLLAILVGAWRARREGENPDHVYNIGILALLGGVIGARFFDVVEYSSRYPNWTLGFDLLDGLSATWILIGLVGGAVLALGGILPTARWSSKAFWVTIGFWAAVLGLVAGRFGYIQGVRNASAAAGTSDPYAGFIEALKVTSGGLTVYGGLLLATALVALYLVFIRYRHGVNPLKMADITAPSVALGLAFGRMGCFLNGCCYGAPCDLPWAITWSPGTIPYEAGLHGPIHPAQLYGVLNGLLLFVLLSLAFRHRRRHGQIIGALFGLYAVSRFLLEMLRLDEAKIYMGGLSISQAVGVFVFGGTIVYFLWLRKSSLADLQWQAAPRAAAVGHANRANHQKRK
jgi:phosphatidylglycerol:prolipoprotein diacylglycerol transferase